MGVPLWGGSNMEYPSGEAVIWEYPSGVAIIWEYPSGVAVS